MPEIIDNRVVFVCPRCDGIDSIECGFCEGSGKVALGGLTADSKDLPDNEAAKIEYI